MRTHFARLPLLLALFALVAAGCATTGGAVPATGIPPTPDRPDRRVVREKLIDSAADGAPHWSVVAMSKGEARLELQVRRLLPSRVELEQTVKRLIGNDWTTAVEVVKERRMLPLPVGQGTVTLVWPGGAAREATWNRTGRASVELPEATELLEGPLTPQPPSALRPAVRVSPVGVVREALDQPLDGTADPALLPLSRLVAQIHGQRLRDYQSRWVDDHRPLLAELSREAGSTFQVGAGLPDEPAPEPWPDPEFLISVDQRIESLEAEEATCADLRRAAFGLRARLERVTEEYLGDLLPKLPPPAAIPRELAGPAALDAWMAPHDVRCDASLAALERARQVKAKLLEAGRARKSLRRTGSVRRIIDDIDHADSMLRAAVGDALFLEYSAAMLSWQEAATRRLRAERSADHSQLERLRQEEAAAEHYAELQAASISLGMVGRSTGLETTLSRAAKRLARLKSSQRDRVFALYTEELTPASPVLLQLLRDRM